MKLTRILGGLILSSIMGVGVATGISVNSKSAHEANAADKSNGVYLPGAWHNSWAEDDTSKMYYHGSVDGHYVYYIGFTISAANQEFKVHDTEHNDWCNNLGTSAQTLAQNWGDNLRIKNGATGSYVLTYCYASNNNKWIENVVSASNWLTLTRKYSINGSDAGSAGSNQQFNFGATLNISNPTAKTGYTFGGWYWAADCNEQSKISSSAIADGWSSSTGQTSTAYAKMVPTTSTVNFDNDGGTGPTSVVATYGSAMPALPSMPTKEGNTFDGYYTAKNGGGTKYYNANGTSAKNWDKTGTQTLYAKWIAAVYTITYDRNLNTGLQATQNKTHGTNVNAYTPGTSPLTAAGWSPSQFKRFKNWNTAWDGSGDTVNASATISSNASFMLYYQEEWYSYRFKINNGSYNYLTYNDSGMPSGVTAQFQSPSIFLPLNGLFTFEYSVDGGSNYQAISISSYEGNYDPTTGIKMQTTDTVYLKANNNGTYSVWVPGISDRSVAICNTYNASSGIPYSMVSDGYTQTKTPSPINVSKGKYLRLGLYGTLHETYLSGPSNYFCQINPNWSIECLLTGAYTVYNLAGDYSNWNDISAVRDEAASAKYLAQLFNQAITNICTGITAGTSDLEDLQNAWGSKVGSALFEEFNNQTNDTMAYFKKNASSDPDIVDCVTRYDYIINKYGTAALPDFLGRNNDYSENPKGAAISALLGHNIESTNAIVIVVVVSLVAVTTIGGYFYLRRKKEQ